MEPMDPGLVEAGLSVRSSAIGYRLSRVLAERARGRAFVEIADGEVSLDKLRRLGFCEITPHPEAHTVALQTWERRGVVSTALGIGAFVVRWNDATFEAVEAQWRDGWDRRHALFLIGAEEPALRAFVAAALDASHVPQKSVLVFASSCFSQDEALYRSSASAAWEDLILPGDLTERVRAEVRSFLGAKDVYERFGIPYKRGILLTGPPGNGKTHCVRLLVKEAGLPTLYVKSFAARYGEEEGNIARVFHRAHQIAPCMLVLEDIDSLVRPHCLSVFLNELDGLRADTGVLTVATTNHPERLDPALLERPSRFDRKYHLGLPGGEERRRYLERWNARFEREMKLDGDSLGTLVERTQGMSFAFLKEVIVSAMTRWVADPRPGALGDVAIGELDGLRATWRAIDEGDAPEAPSKPESR